MLLTQDQVKKILPLNVDYVEWTNLLNEYLGQYDIDSLERTCMFIAQCSHESKQFTVIKENLNYSSKGLLITFPKHFNLAMADLYQRHPEKIANRVYANRYLNGDERSGDGWKYRGRGLLQITFKANYDALATYINKTLDEVVSYLETKEGALVASLFYWHEHQLNSFADANDIEGATKRINGGTVGLDDRISEYNRILSILS